MSAASRGKWSRPGPGGCGGTLHHVFHPRDSKIIIYGSDMGGFFLTRNHGRSWQMNELSGTTRCFAFDPGDPNGLGVVSLSTLLAVDQAGLLTVRGKALSDPARRFVSVMEETIDSNHQRPR